MKWWYYRMVWWSAGQVLLFESTGCLGPFCVGTSASCLVKCWFQIGLWMVVFLSVLVLGHTGDQSRVWPLVSERLGQDPPRPPRDLELDTLKKIAGWMDNIIYPKGQLHYNTMKIRKKTLYLAIIHHCISRSKGKVMAIFHMWIDDTNLQIPSKSLLLVLSESGQRWMQNDTGLSGGGIQPQGCNSACRREVISTFSSNSILCLLLFSCMF